MPITGFCGFVLTSATGAKSRLTPVAASSVPSEVATRSVKPDVVDDAEGGVPRVRAAGGRLEPRHVAAFLVDRDDHICSFGAQIVGQRAELLRALDVPGVEDDAPQPLRQAPPYPVGRGRPDEAREDAARGELLEVAHPLTAPAVRPKAILR